MKPLLIGLLLTISCVCYCQQKRDSLYFAKLGEESLTQHYETNISARIPFKSIKIIDARPDTSSIGFLKLHLLGSIHKQVFDSGLSNEILSFTENNYQLNNNDSAKDLLLIIKEYRISRFAKAFNSRAINTLNWLSGVIINAELFMQNKNSFHALYKIDTIVLYDTTHSLNQLVQKSFEALFYKVVNKDFSKLHTGKTEFSGEDIEKHIESIYDFPILKDSILNKGVYNNFIEFKFNNPSIKTYKIRTGKLSDELYATDNNQSYPLQDYWGYCDGKNLYIRSEKKLFQLHKTGNTFNVKGMKSFWVVQSRQGTNAYTNYDADLFPFQLNMQNGELY